MTAWWYWALFALAALIFTAPYLAHRWEERRNRQDAELWARTFGGDIYSRKVD